VPLPGAEALAATGLTLPLFPGMAEWQVELTLAIVSRLVRLDAAP
jgi:dTDP-4-amino-4,6-dideoxygalactose transaminase